MAPKHDTKPWRQRDKVLYRYYLTARIINADTAGKKGIKRDLLIPKTMPKEYSDSYNIAICLYRYLLNRNMYPIDDILTETGTIYDSIITSFVEGHLLLDPKFDEGAFKNGKNVSVKVIKINKGIRGLRYNGDFVEDSIINDFEMFLTKRELQLVGMFFKSLDLELPKRFRCNCTLEGYNNYDSEFINIKRKYIDKKINLNNLNKVIGDYLARHNNEMSDDEIILLNLGQLLKFKSVQVPTIFSHPFILLGYYHNDTMSDNYDNKDSKNRKGR